MKHWPQFLLCLLLSASFWLIHNLSQVYAGVVSVPVVAHSGIKGRSAESRDAVTVSARCSATGFKLLQLKHSGKTLPVDIHAEDLVWAGGDNYTVSASEMAKYTSDIFGDGVTLITFLNQSYTFEFASENYKTVPVRPVIDISYRSQYMPSGPIRLSPDSVTVYGEDVKLAAIDEVVTKSLTYNDVAKDIGGVAHLVRVPGIRMSDTEVTWSLDVVRFVEVKSTVSLKLKNVPPGVDFHVYPSSAEVLFHCHFPSKGDPAADCEFYIDYEEFASSLSGRCLARCDELPAYVIDWDIEPDIFECLVMEGAR